MLHYALSEDISQTPNWSTWKEKLRWLSRGNGVILPGIPDQSDPKDVKKKLSRELVWRNEVIKI